MVLQRKMTIPIFNYKLTVLIYDDYSEIEHLFEPVSTPPKGTTATTYGAALVAIHYKQESTIAHEAEHVKNSIWEFIGYIPQRDNDEVDAYLLTYIYEKIKAVHVKFVANYK